MLVGGKGGVLSLGGTVVLSPEGNGDPPCHLRRRASSDTPVARNGSCALARPFLGESNEERGSSVGELDDDGGGLAAPPSKSDEILIEGFAGADTLSSS